jgi:cytochrome b561
VPTFGLSGGHGAQERAFAHPTLVRAPERLSTQNGNLVNLILKWKFGFDSHPRGTYVMPRDLIAVHRAARRLAAARLAGDDGAGECEKMQSVARYHPFLVVIHWLLAVLIVSALALGALVMVRIPNSDPMKIEAVRSHMIGGSLILILMLVRLFVRVGTAHPAAAATGNSTLDRIARLSHRLLYVLVLGQAGSGLFLALQAGLPDIVFAGNGALPAHFWVFPVRSVHYAISRLLMALIALHVTGAVYHTLVLRDGLLRRMWFGRRDVHASNPILTSNRSSSMVQP